MSKSRTIMVDYSKLKEILDRRNLSPDFVSMNLKRANGSTYDSKYLAKRVKNSGFIAAQVAEQIEKEFGILRESYCIFPAKAEQIGLDLNDETVEVSRGELTEIYDKLDKLTKAVERLFRL